MIFVYVSPGQRPGKPNAIDCQSPFGQRREGFSQPISSVSQGGIDSGRTEPQRGFTTKPGVAVTTAHPRKNDTNPGEPQRGSTLQLPIWVQESGDVEPRWGSNQFQFKSMARLFTGIEASGFHLPTRAIGRFFPATKQHKKHKESKTRSMK